MAVKSDSTFPESSQSKTPKPGYTPGPWIARPYPESKNQRITITGATSPIAIAEIVPTTMKGYDAIAEANGRLIAAAPMLLDLLKQTLAELDFEIEQRQHGGNAEDWCDLIRLSDEAHATIRKATGGAP
jgi:hypothetical protein